MSRLHHAVRITENEMESYTNLVCRRHLGHSVSSEMIFAKYLLDKFRWRGVEPNNFRLIVRENDPNSAGATFYLKELLDYGAEADWDRFFSQPYGALLLGGRAVQTIQSFVGKH